MHAGPAPGTCPRSRLSAPAALDSPPAACPLPPRALPALRRLHLSSCWRTYAALWPYLAAHFPALRALRISGVLDDAPLPLFLHFFLDVPLAREDVPEALMETYVRLQELYAPPPGVEGAVPAAASWLPELRRILVCPRALANEPNEPFENDEMKGMLCNIAEACANKKGDRELHVLPERGMYALEEAFADWQDLVDAGDGLWAVVDCIRTG